MAECHNLTLYLVGWIRLQGMLKSLDPQPPGKYQWIVKKMKGHDPDQEIARKYGEFLINQTTEP